MNIMHNFKNKWWPFSELNTEHKHASLNNGYKTPLKAMIFIKIICSKKKKGLWHSWKKYKLTSQQYVVIKGCTYACNYITLLVNKRILKFNNLKTIIPPNNGNSKLVLKSDMNHVAPAHFLHLLNGFEDNWFGCMDLHDCWPNLSGAKKSYKNEITGAHIWLKHTLTFPLNMSVFHGYTNSSTLILICWSGFTTVKLAYTPSKLPSRQSTCLNWSSQCSLRRDLSCTVSW